MTEFERRRKAREARDCPTCNERFFDPRTGRWMRGRETVGMVCPRCGWDYGRDGEP